MLHAPAWCDVVHGVHCTARIDCCDSGCFVVAFSSFLLLSYQYD